MFNNFKKFLYRKSIAAASHGLDQMILADSLQRFSEPTYMYIYRALLDKNLCAPHMAEQLRSAVYPFSMAHKKMQQSKFCWPQFNIDTACFNPMRYGRQL